MMLELKSMKVAYGRVMALHGIDVQIQKGEIVSLIGANGAGKSTTLKCLSGLVSQVGGSLLYKGEDITALSAPLRVKKGLVHVPEGRRLFADMSVEENLELGAYTRGDAVAIRETLEHCYELFPQLAKRRRQRAGTLSGGEQQMAAIARGLMARPQVLMLDEPSLGLAPIIVQQIFKIIETINREGVTILLVEQNAAQALRVSHRSYVLEVGRISLSGESEDLLHDEAVIKSYLGG
jgi:branched-chain amino acid transport system ATP-binding protein